MLHIIHKSPFNSDALKLATQHCKASDIVIFIDDACYALSGPHPLVSKLIEGGTCIKAITEHIDARAINCNSSHRISMSDFVDISFTQEKNMSWY